VVLLLLLLLLQGCLVLVSWGRWAATCWPGGAKMQRARQLQQRRGTIDAALSVTLV
jgi:hypothetical protein